MILLVTGGRFWHNQPETYKWLDALHNEYDVTTLIHGDAKGADRLARDWALARGIELKTYCANWDRYGKKAGPIRNQQMIDEGNPDMLIAFLGGVGTADMVRRANKANIYIVHWAPPMSDNLEMEI